MRTIKFRGKRIDEPHQWEYGYIQVDGKDVWMHTIDGRVMLAIPETVGQFTGKLAGRRTEIYDGDIISVTDMMGDMAGGQTRRGIVKWDERRLAFVIDFDDPWDDHPVLFEEVDCDDFFFATVIGNIYENGSEQIKTEQRDSRPVKTLSDNG